MVLLNYPLLQGLEIARQAASDAAHQDDDVTVDDQGDCWVFEFIPQADVLGGGARVLVAKEDLRVREVVRGQ